MNEVEKKEIDILASDIDYAITSRDISLKDKREIAKALILLGYGKIEDYKKEIKRLKEENLQLNNSFVEASVYLKSLTKELFVLSKSNKEIEQQAIKKFAQQLIENQSCHNVMCETVYYISDNDIKIALKEFGIGE